MYTFKSSINPKFDYGDEDLIRNYIPTSSHIDAFKNVVVSSNSNTNSNSHLIVGAYGTGKSYLTTILIGLLSRIYPLEALKELATKILDLPNAENLADLITREDSSKKYLPVILSGYEGEFRTAVLDAIYNAIQKNKIEIDFPGQISTILRTINRWQAEYPTAYQELEKLIKAEEYSDVQSFTERIKNSDLRAIKLFSNIYSHLTFGEILPPDSSDVNFIQSIEYIIDQLQSQGYGLVLLYDEFGRFLQNQDQSEIYKTLQDIQDLSEFANNGTQALQLILVSHKDLVGYYSKYKNSFQEEFRRVEGRFRQYVIRTDEKVFSSIIKSWFDRALPTRVIDEDYIAICQNKLRVYNLFDLSSEQVERDIIKGSYPVHPVTLFLLTKLSNRFGQNERTLYTFFEQSEGIEAFLSSRKSGQVMSPDYLYDYFFANSITDVNVEAIERRTTTNISVHKSYFPDINTEEDVRVYRFLTLWEAAELVSKERITTDFISFSQMISLEEAEQIIKRLIQSGVIRFNYQTRSYESKNPSPINLEKLITERVDSREITNADISDMTSRYLTKKYVKAFDYNRIKKMVRYAAINLLIDPDLSTLVKATSISGSDMTIQTLIKMNDDLDSENVFQSISQSLPASEILYVPDINFEAIKAEAARIAAIEDLLLDSDVRKEGDSVLEELNYFKKAAESEFSSLLNPINSGNFTGRFYYKGSSRKIEGEPGLARLISDYLTEAFPKTPIVLNENFNKNRIAAVQRKASANVIDAILQHSAVEGNGPDSLIAYSVFTANKFDYLEMDNSGSALNELQKELIKTLESKTSLNDIINLFTSCEFGYGIRKPVIPVLFTGLLNNIWDNLMFFNSGSVMTDLTGQNIIEMFDRPEGVAVNYHTYSDSQTKIIQEIISSFGYSSEDKGKPNHLKAGNILYRWMKSLPRYSQISFDMDEDLIGFRDVINFFKVDPIKMIDQLAEIGIDNIQSYKTRLDSYLFDRNDVLVTYLLEQTQFKNLEDLRTFIKELPDKARLTSKISNVLLSNSDVMLISHLSEALIGVPLGEWSDNTKKVFIHEFKKEIERLKGNKTDRSQLLVNLDGTKAIIHNSELSTQATNLSNRIHAMINAQNQRVSRDEIKTILFQTLLNLIEEDGSDERKS